MSSCRPACPPRTAEAIPSPIAAPPSTSCDRYQDGTLAAFSRSRKTSGMTMPSHTPRWRTVQAPSLDDFETMADEAYRQLPEHFRALCKDLVIRIAEYPTDEVLDGMGIESELDLLGLFQGIGL